MSSEGAVVRSPFLRIQDFMSARARRKILEDLRRSVDTGPEVRLIDIGGGTGAASELFARGSKEVVVLEPDRKKVAYGRERRTWIRFVEGGAENIPFPDGYFDRAVALVSFHHIEDQEKALSEIDRVVKSSGRIVLHEFDPSSPRGKLSRFFENDVMRRGLRFHNPAGLKAMVERHGFRNVAVAPDPVGYLLIASK